MNLIVGVGDGDGLYGEQWNLLGDSQVSIVPRDLHPKTPLKCDFSIWAGPNTFTFWSANFQIKLAPLILYTTLVYTSTLKSTV